MFVYVVFCLLMEPANSTCKCFCIITPCFAALLGLVESGIQRVAFNVNRNRSFQAFEQGDFSEQIRSPTNGRYVFEVKRKLDEDDIIYVWISVQFKTLIYRELAVPITIRESQSQTNKSISSPARVPTPTPLVISFEDNSECTPARTKVTRQGQRYVPRCKGELIFNEEFDGSSLDTKIWTAEIRLPTDICEEEFVLYNTSNIKVHNSLLTIEASLWNENRPGTEIRQGLLDLGNQCTERLRSYCRRQAQGAKVLPPVLSGRINSKISFSFQYGRVLARAKFLQGDWLYPLLLLETVLVLINDPHPCLHTRLAFSRGNELWTNISGTEDIGAHRLSGGVIFTTFANDRYQFMVNKTSWEIFAKDFHTYELMWNYESLIFKVDEKEYGHIRFIAMRLG